MLPSFRLIVATFLCGFAVVFAGLRLAVSLNGALPVTAAHAGGHVLPIADGEIHLASVPAMFDTRFAITPTMPMATSEPAKQPSQPDSVLATVQPDPPADPVAPAEAAAPALPDAPPPAGPQP
jgi:hypothetical protein